jgi:DNA-binding PadR family transcriptional regulator
MPIHHAVLGLLADRPSYGYELKANFEEAVGPQWGSLNIGHLYQVLDRLERDGLVTKRIKEQTRRPDRVIYRLAKQGRAELDRWLARPVDRPGGYRDDFFLKLFVASRLGEPALRGILDVQRRDYLEQLSRLGGLRALHGDEPLKALLLDAAILRTEASLELVERAKRNAAQIVAAAARQTTAPQAVATERA